MSTTEAPPQPPPKLLEPLFTAPVSPSNQQPQFRLWTDARKQCKLHAQFLFSSNGRVQLRRPNGQFVMMALENLSPEDRLVVKFLSRSSGDDYGMLHPPLDANEGYGKEIQREVQERVRPSWIDQPVYDLRSRVLESCNDQPDRTSGRELYRSLARCYQEDRETLRCVSPDVKAWLRGSVKDVEGGEECSREEGEDRRGLKEEKVVAEAVDQMDDGHFDGGEEEQEQSEFEELKRKEIERWEGVKTRSRSRWRRLVSRLVCR